MDQNINCEFCSGIANQEIFRNNFIKVITPNRPVVEGHLMIMPIRHVVTFDDLSEDELIQIQRAIITFKKAFNKKGSFAGYNLISNNGKKSGQEILHFHMHFFPRYYDEIASPFTVMNNPKAYPREKLIGDDLTRLVRDLKILFKTY